MPEPARPQLPPWSALALVFGMLAALSWFLASQSPPGAVYTDYTQAEVIVYGHTHKAMITRVGDTLVVNPGAAGPRRFEPSPSVARLNIARGGAHVEILPLG